MFWCNLSAGYGSSAQSPETLEEQKQEEVEEKGERNEGTKKGKKKWGQQQA